MEDCKLNDKAFSQDNMPSQLTLVIIDQNDITTAKTPA